MAARCPGSRTERKQGFLSVAFQPISHVLHGNARLTMARPQRRLPRTANALYGWFSRSGPFVPDSPRQDLTESLDSACSLHVQRLPMGSHEQRALLSDTRSRSREGWQGLEAPRGGRGAHASWHRPICRDLAWRPSGRLERTANLVVVAPQLLAGRNRYFLTNRGTAARISLHSEVRNLQQNFSGPAATPCRCRYGFSVKRIIRQ